MTMILQHPEEVVQMSWSAEDHDLMAEEGTMVYWDLLGPFRQ